MLAYLKERKVSKSLVFPFVCKGDMEDLLQVATWGLVAIRNLNLRQHVKIFSLVLARKKLLLQPLTYMFNPPKRFRNKFRILSTHGLPSLYSALSCTGQVSLPQDYYRSL